MCLNVRDARDRIAEREQVLVSPNRCELPAVNQRLSKRDMVDRLATTRELVHRLENLGVGLAVEVVGGQRLYDDVHRLVLEEDPAEHCAFCVERVRRDLPDLLR